ncbi:MAG: hypothetical protein HW391_289 [Chloroflexi bacterium]|nr:hypothetical protein [Chloroflexota bacterium]
MSMKTDAPGIPLGDWLERLAEVLPTGAQGTVSAAEQAALLDIARIAAHTSERIAAPISTYLAGLALATAEPDDRVAGLQRIVARLEPGD